MRKFIISLLIFTSLFVVSCENINITAPKEERKTAVLFSSLAEIWTKAGGRVDITVGETIERGFAPTGTPIVDSGAGKSINLELLISLKPNLVICSSDIPAQAEAAKILQNSGIQVLLLRIESFSDYLDALKAMTDITGNSTVYEDEKSNVGSFIKSIFASDEIKEINATKILFLRAGSTASSTKTKSSEEHFAAAMLKEMGCVNLADSAISSELGIEAILESDPQHIFISLMGDEEAARQNVESLLKSEAWSSLDAVKCGRIHILPRDLFHFKPCTRWGEAYRYLADILISKE